MNDEHLSLLTSPEWHRYLELEILPWIVANADLTGDVLEIGPGPGLLTDLIHRRTGHLVAVEIDPELAASLARRMVPSDVEVLCADAARTTLPSGRFATAIACTMLHHVPSPAAQNDLFAEAYRLLQPDGRFLAVDSLDSATLRAFHVGDTFVPVDATTMRGRLEAVGFCDVGVEEWVAATRPGAKVRLVATRPK